MKFILLILLFFTSFLSEAKINRAPKGVSNIQSEVFYYNTKSHIYHYHSCRWAKKCTRNCINANLKKVLELGGRSCKVCH